jgi:hypothetical protein
MRLPSDCRKRDGFSLPVPFIPGHPVQGREYESGEVLFYRQPPAIIRNDIEASGLTLVKEWFFHPSPEWQLDPTCNNGLVAARKLSS